MRWSSIYYGVAPSRVSDVNSGKLRYFGSYPEGMSFAILLMNCTVPLLNMWFHQKKYGRA